MANSHLSSRPPMSRVRLRLTDTRRSATATEVSNIPPSSNSSNNLGRRDLDRPHWAPSDLSCLAWAAVSKRAAPRGLHHLDHRLHLGLAAYSVVAGITQQLVDNDPLPNTAAILASNR